MDLDLDQYHLKYNLLNAFSVALMYPYPGLTTWDEITYAVVHLSVEEIS